MTPPEAGAAGFARPFERPKQVADTAPSLHRLRSAGRQQAEGFRQLLAEAVSAALRYIRNHVADGINVEDVLGEVGVSRATLVKRMKKATGRTPVESINHARVDKAKQLLLTTDAKMEQIARQCGFRRHPRLQELFKRLTGLTPGQYRQQRSR